MMGSERNPALNSMNTNAPIQSYKYTTTEIQIHNTALILPDCDPYKMLPALNPPRSVTPLKKLSFGQI